MLKALIEKRAALIAEMETLVASLSATKDGKTEVRAFTDDERRAYDEKKAEVDRLTTTINAVREERGKEVNIPVDGDKQGEKSEESIEEAETRAFEQFLRCGTGLETRADSNWTVAENASVIPVTIADKIIAKVVDVSPIFARATKYHVKGSLTIPYYDRTTGTVQMEYADEFTEGESTSGKIKSIALGGYLARAKSLISKKLINNSKFDIVSYAIDIMAQEIALWIDGELINGTTDRIAGLSTATQIVTAASTVAVTSDELIDLQDMVPDVYQGNSIWVMSRATRTAIRKLKDGDGNYLLQKDATSKWGYSLFGKSVYIADAISDMEAGKIAILYGDFSGLAVKISEDIAVEVLREKYAEQHAVGLLAWLEMDSKVENDQKISVLKMAS